MVNFSGRDFSPTRNLITMRCSTLRGTFSSLITPATPRQDWTGSNPSRREGGGCGFTLSRSHSCCAVRLLYIQTSPGHIWTTLYNVLQMDRMWAKLLDFSTQQHIVKFYKMLGISGIVYLVWCQGCTKPRRLKLVLWSFIFDGPHYETCLMSSFWRIEFWAGS